MSDGIQFDKAQFGSGEHCVDCQNPLQGSYFRLNRNTLCSGCADKARCDHQLHQSQSGGLGRALVFGLGAAVAGAAIYGLILSLTGYEFGLIAILNGWMVGKAMMRGSRDKGGRRFQYVALLVTYLSITAGYVPTIINELRNMSNASADKESAAETDSKAATAPVSTDAEADAPPLTATGLLLGFAVMLGIAAILPVLNVTAGISGLIGVAIIVFGLMQAWKETQEKPFALSGPFVLEPHDTGTSEAPA